MRAAAMATWARRGHVAMAYLPMASARSKHPAARDARRHAGGPGGFLCAVVMAAISRDAPAQVHVGVDNPAKRRWRHRRWRGLRRRRRRRAWRGARRRAWRFTHISLHRELVHVEAVVRGEAAVVKRIIRAALSIAFAQLVVHSLVTSWVRCDGGGRQTQAGDGRNTAQAARVAGGGSVGASAQGGW